MQKHGSSCADGTDRRESSSIRDEDDAVCIDHGSPEETLHRVEELRCPALRGQPRLDQSVAEPVRERISQQAGETVKGHRGQCGERVEPNTPLIAGRKAFAQYDVDAIRLPASLRDEMAASPAFYRRQREIFSHWTDAEWRLTRAVYYALITELDAQLGLLLDALERSGQRENTIVVVSSDHGRYMSAHGLDAHNFGAFEEVYNVPLIIAGPGVAAGAVSDALVSTVSLGPTLLEMAGAEPLGAPDSRSFAPLLRDPAGAAADLDTCYAEFYGTRFWLTQRILWRGPWKLVFNGFDYDELYNLEQDPHELRNLGTDPAYESVYRRLMAEIWRIARETGDTVLLETHYAPMRFAVVGPNADTSPRPHG
jgi:arylsulfatase A-like enzyme